MSQVTDGQLARHRERALSSFKLETINPTNVGGTPLPRQ